ncbi:MAG: OsmC family protein [Gemmatimonadales bacterium]|nr:OsmC family protein [Gemmatimonadales bacterium]
MGRYHATIEWEGKGAAFTDNRYSRAHRWKFDGGLDVPASSSPHVVPVPRSDPAAVDPEEAFVASLASCHMLWFLSIAASRGWVVERYRDAAEGVLGPDHDGNTAMLEVVLRPEVTFGNGRAPGAAGLRELHHLAHEECFLARSVRTRVTCEPISAPLGVLQVNEPA